MKQAFETERLVVFEARFVPGPQYAIKRTVFVAFRKDEDRPLVCATAVLEKCPYEPGDYVDWLEVTSEYRRQGFATELLDGIEKHRGRLHYDAGSKDGRAFLAAREA